MDLITADWLRPDFDLAGAALALLFAGYLAIVVPAFSKRGFAQLRELLARDPGKRGRVYLRMIAVTSLMALVPLALLAGEVTAGDLGLARPSGPQLGTAIGLAVMLVVATAAMNLDNRRRIRAGQPVPGYAAVEPLLPRTAGQRWLVVVLGVVVGISEELVFRGLLIATGVGVLGLAPWVAALAALVVFAANHVYQGRVGLATSTAVGALLTLIYLLSGSILVPMLTHAILDICTLTLVPPPRREAGPRPDLPIPKVLLPRRPAIEPLADDGATVVTVRPASPTLRQDRPDSEPAG